MNAFCGQLISLGLDQIDREKKEKELVALGELASADKKAAEEALEELRSQMEDLRDARAAREAKEAVVSGSKVKSMLPLPSCYVTLQGGRLRVYHLENNSRVCVCWYYLTSEV